MMFRGSESSQHITVLRVFFEFQFDKTPNWMKDAILIDEVYDDVYLIWNEKYRSLILIKKIESGLGWGWV